MQIAEQYSGSIGRMFARQNVPTVYGRQDRDGSRAQENGVAGAADRVELSPYAPKPLDASLFEQAWETGTALGQGAKPTPEQDEKIREDRVFAALAAMTMLGMEGSDTEPDLGWPGGIPAPTRQEMDEARRRLSQRFQRLEHSRDPAAAQENRMVLLEKLAGRNLAAPAAAGMAGAAGVAAAVG